MMVNHGKDWDVQLKTMKFRNVIETKVFSIKK